MCCHQTTKSPKATAGPPRPSDMTASRPVNSHREPGASRAVLAQVANTSNTLLPAILKLLRRFSGRAASKEDLLLAAVRTVQSLMTCAGPEYTSVIGHFSTLFDDSSPLRQLLQVGPPAGASLTSSANSNSNGGSNVPREQVPSRLRAAVLSLMSPHAPGSG